MNLIPVLKMAMLTGACSLHGQVDHADQTVPVCFQNSSRAPQWVAHNAQVITAQMLAAIGVSIEWLSANPCASKMDETRPIILTITDHTPRKFYPGGLAVTQPFEGVHIRILYDRLGETVSLPNMSSVLLAHVMAHEIGHILQGVARHSGSGIMRERWKHDDYLAMQNGALRFETLDMKLIHHGLTARKNRLAQRKIAASATPAQ